MTHKPFTLHIAEWTHYDYFRFDHERPARFIKDDVILWVCDEMMDFLAYTEFAKQTNATKRDIVAIIIKQKKSDWKYTEFENPYQYEFDEDDDL